MKKTQEHQELVGILTQFSQHMDERLDSMDQQFVQIGKKFIQIDNRFNQIDKHFERIEVRLERVEARLEKTTTKEDLQKTERAIRKDMATKEDVKNSAVRGDIRLNMLIGKLVGKKVLAPAEVDDILNFHLVTA